MNYTDAELDVLQQENYVQELEQDVCQFAPPMKSASLNDLKTSDNPDNFQEVDYLISKGANLQMRFGIDDGLPYYEVKISPDRNVTLYLNKEIIRYLYSWIKDGVKLPKAPNTWDVQNNASDRYRLYLMKRDYENGVLRMDKFFYLAKYPKGYVTYGIRPLSLDKMIAEFNQLS